MSVKKAIPFGSIKHSPKGNIRAYGTKENEKKVGEKPGKRNDDKNMRTIGCNNVVLSTKRGLNKNVFPYFVEDVSN